MARARRTKTDSDALFNAAAEALILFDPHDSISKDELLGALTAIADALEAEDPYVRPIELALEAAHAACAGDADAMARLEKLFDEARSGVTTARDLQTKAKRGKPSTSSSAGTTAAVKPMPLAGDEDLLRDFGVRASEHLDDVDERLLALESDPGHKDSVDAVFRAFHTIKGMAGFLALDAISEAAHSSESILAKARSTGAALATDEVNDLFAAVDGMRRLVAQVTGVQSSNGSECAASSEVSREQVASGRDRVSSRSGTVRVSQERLDALIDMIGELVIAESTVSAESRQLKGVGPVIGKLDQLDKITRELQQMATSLRMVPLRAMMHRMARLVRDLSSKAGKPVDFVTSGEDTELDKSVVDRIEDPLVHALRNAIDHGVEAPDERRSAGKPETARVELHAYHAGGAIHIEVRDDGRGLDARGLQAAGAGAGLVTTDGDMDARTLLDVMCAPGVSTAERVTDVSGRGVGMDVVRRTVEELRGRLEVDSEPGRGTTFGIRLPVTLAIIDGMVLRVGQERFILPLLSIERSVRPAANNLSRVAGRGEMLAAEGEGLLPVLRLHEMFGVPDAEDDATKAVVVITRDAGARAGLLACELLGQQQTVIKPLGDSLPDTQGIAGGAVMPDGRVGLILDAAGLVRLAQDRGGE